MAVNSDFSKDTQIVLKNDVLYYIHKNLPSNGGKNLVKTTCDLYTDKLISRAKILMLSQCKEKLKTFDCDVYTASVKRRRKTPNRSSADVNIGDIINIINAFEAYENDLIIFPENPDKIPSISPEKQTNANIVARIDINADNIEQLTQKYNDLAIHSNYEMKCWQLS